MRFCFLFTLLPFALVVTSLPSGISRSLFPDWSWPKKSNPPSPSPKTIPTASDLSSGARNTAEIKSDPPNSKPPSIVIHGPSDDIHHIDCRFWLKTTPAPGKPETALTTTTFSIKGRQRAHAKSCPPHPGTAVEENKCAVVDGSNLWKEINNALEKSTQRHPGSQDTWMEKLNEKNRKQKSEIKPPTLKWGGFKDIDARGGKGWEWEAIVEGVAPAGMNDWLVEVVEEGIYADLEIRDEMEKKEKGGVCMNVLGPPTDHAKPGKNSKIS